jgi:SAM-dependent methyltransferase
MEKLRLLKKILASYKENNRFKTEHSDLHFPPYRILHDTLATCSYKAYYDSGIAHARVICSLIRAFKKESRLVACEWGCGPARIIQHLKALDTGISRLIGTDYNEETVRWCRQHYPDIVFLINGIRPPLNIEQHSLDVLYSISVFTHLSEELHYAWIEEILRVLKPGGLFIGSFHGDNFKFKLLADELERYEKSELVVRDKVFEGSRLYSCFHSDVFVKDKLLRQFKKVTKGNDASLAQTIWCGIAP